MNGVLKTVKEPKQALKALLGLCGEERGVAWATGGGRCRAHEKCC